MRAASLQRWWVLAPIALAASALGARAPAARAHDVPVLVARRAAGVKIDGRLDEPAWERAHRVGPFVVNATGAPARGGATHARALWDDERLYLAFEVEDRDVWARDAERDDVHLPADEVVEAFLDDGGEGAIYYEVEVSPANAIYDLLCVRAPAAGDAGAAPPVTGFPHWDAKPIGALGGSGLETAVVVHGTLARVASGADPLEEPPDEDRGYTVELALPWSALWTTRRHQDPARVPPRVGDRWRLGLYRVERPRPVAPGPPARIDAAEARRRAGVPDERFDALVAAGALVPDDQGRFDALAVARVHAAERAEYQAWSPTRDASFHHPDRFGVLEFGE